MHPAPAGGSTTSVARSRRWSSPRRRRSRRSRRRTRSSCSTGRTSTPGSRPTAGRRSGRWRTAYLETVPGAGPIETKGKFGDIQLHVEWAAPDPPARRGPGPRQQRHLPDGPVRDPGARLLQGRHLRRRPGRGDLRPVSRRCSTPRARPASGRPTTSPSAAPGSTRPASSLEPARMTLFHNGILVQNNEEPFGPTSWLKWLPYKDQGDRGPIALQDHDHPVRYRNIWLRELPERPAPTAEGPRPAEDRRRSRGGPGPIRGPVPAEREARRPDGHDRPRGRPPGRHVPVPAPAARARADLRDRVRHAVHRRPLHLPQGRGRPRDRRPVPDRRRRAGHEAGRALKSAIRSGPRMLEVFPAQPPRAPPFVKGGRIRSGAPLACPPYEGGPGGVLVHGLPPVAQPNCPVL